MSRVYQRARFALRAPAGPSFPLFALFLLAACGRGAAPGPRSDIEPVVARRLVPFESIVATRSYELVAVAAERAGEPGAILATEWSADGGRALAFRMPDAAAPGTPDNRSAPVAPIALALPTAPESRALAALAHGLFLIEELDRATLSTRLALVDGKGRHLPLAPLVALGQSERFLVGTDDGRRFWSAAKDVAGAAGADDLLLETSLPAGMSGAIRRVADRIAAPYEIAALSPDGAFAALRRAIHDEADEIVLLDRASRDMRLLLPDRDEGRFRPLAFLGDGKLLLLLADDGGDGFRFEKMVLASGKRSVIEELEPGCLAAALRALPGGELRLDRLCRGARSSERAELSGRALPLPPSPESTRTVAFLPISRIPAGAAEFALAAAGGRWPADLWLASPDAGLEPLTYGLAPGLLPESLDEPEAMTVAAPGATLPAELWPSAGAARAGIVWLESDGTPPAWRELEPTFAALASRGFSVLRYRGRGADGFGRALRRAADGDVAGAALDDVARAAAVLESRLGAVLPIGLVGAGDWAGSVALAAAALGPAVPSGNVPGSAPDSTPGIKSRERFAAVVALFPALDPLAALDSVATATEPRKSRLLARWGDPSERLRLEQRASWRFPVEAARRPTLVLLDRDREESAGLVETVDAARAKGAPVEAALVRRLRFAPRVARDASLRLAEFLERHLTVTAEEPAQ